MINEVTYENILRHLGEIHGTFATNLSHHLHAGRTWDICDPADHAKLKAAPHRLSFLRQNTVKSTETNLFLFGHPRLFRAPPKYRNQLLQNQGRYGSETLDGGRLQLLLKIQCDDCENGCIAETGRKTETRIAEHELNVASAQFIIVKPGSSTSSGWTATVRSPRRCPRKGRKLRILSSLHTFKVTPPPSTRSVAPFRIYVYQPTLSVPFSPTLFLLLLLLLDSLFNFFSFSSLFFSFSALFFKVAPFLLLPPHSSLHISFSMFHFILFTSPVCMSTPFQLFPSRCCISFFFFSHPPFPFTLLSRYFIS